MARKRMIDPSFWDDPKVGRMPDPMRLFVVGCISLADDDGRLVGDVNYLKSVIFKYKNYPFIAIKEIGDFVCSELKGFQLYEIDGEEYIQLRNWLKYQVIRRDIYKKSTLPPPPRHKTDTQASQDRNESGTQSINKSINKLSIEALKALKEIMTDKEFNDHLLKKGYTQEEIEEELNNLGSQDA